LFAPGQSRTWLLRFSSNQHTKRKGMPMTPGSAPVMLLEGASRGLERAQGRGQNSCNPEAKSVALGGNPSEKLRKLGESGLKQSPA